MDTVDQVTAIDSTLRTARVKLTLGEPPSDTVHEQFMTAHAALSRNVFRLGIWGPDQARVNGQNIAALAQNIYNAWAQWEHAVNSGTPADEFIEAFQAARQELNAQWGQLIVVAKQSLRAPEEGDSQGAAL